MSRLADCTTDWPALSEEDRARYTASDDMLDALVAALAVRAASIDRCEPIPSGGHELAQEEGWIALPETGSLNQLA